MERDAGPNAPPLEGRKGAFDVFSHEPEVGVKPVVAHPDLACSSTRNQFSPVILRTLSGVVMRLSAATSSR